jgi:FKBP-type peptidyl-prolyl cis-trans isomerase
MDSNITNSSNNSNIDFAQYDKYKDAEKVIIEDIVVGTGPEVKTGNNIVVHYRGWLTDGQIFDESYGRGEPFSFTPGQRRVITGWEDGTIGMQVGGKRRLVVPPVAGYGNSAVGTIPASSVLVFDIELLAVR